MGTWTAVIVDTQRRADFWKAVHAEGVEPVRTDVPSLALVEVSCGADFDATFRLAESLSTMLGTAAIGFVAQSASDAYELRAYDRGSLARRLAYSRDDGGWIANEGIVQPWEPDFFFDGHAAAPQGEGFPDLIDDDLSDADLARYEEARRAREPARVMDLLNPRSLAPFHRLCAFYRIAPDAPAATWTKPSIWSRLFG